MKPLRGLARGLSLLEIVIAVAILSVISVLLSQLLLTAHAEVSRSGRRLGDPQVDLVVSRLRVELRGALPVTPPFGLDELWTDSPLEIRRPSVPHTTLYSLDGTTLRRSLYHPGEYDPFSEAVVLRDVERFRWRTVPGLSGRAVAIEILWDETPHRVGVVVAAGQSESLTPTRRTARLVVFTRGGGGRSW